MNFNVTRIVPTVSKSQAGKLARKPVHELSGKRLAQQQALLLYELRLRAELAKQPVKIMPDVNSLGLWG